MKNKSEAKALIQAMIDKPYLYNGEQVTVSSYTVIEDEYLISLSNNEIIRSFARNLKDTLHSKLKPLATPKKETSASSAKPALSNSLSESIVSLKDILMDNITKVQKDKKYIGQAREINNSVKEIINLAKVDIEYQKLAQMK